MKSVFFVLALVASSVASATEFNFSLTGEPTVPSVTPNGYLWECRDGGSKHACQYD